MTYLEATDWLFQQLPMFQRQGPAAYKSNLDGTKYVLERMGRPDLHLDGIIHVAGTNGKGSVCTAVSNALVETGFRVGLFTSPHLDDFRERMQVCGDMPPESWVAERVNHFREELPTWSYQPSFFEWTFGLALLWFAEEQVDVVVLETGMGGRLDSTNIFPAPLITVVTNIGLDHQQFLGNDIRSIAAEKAGILKDGVPVVLGRMRPEAQSIILAAALRSGSEVHYANRSNPASIESGPFWPENEATAKMVLEVLADQPGWRSWVPPSSVHSTGYRGRWEWMSPLESGARVLVDCAHNVDGLERFASAIETIQRARLLIVMGTVADKDVSGLWSLLPDDAEYFFCAADIPRSMDALKLQSAGHAADRNGTAHSSVENAIAAVCNQAEAQDLVVVMGSIFVAAEALKVLQ